MAEAQRDEIAKLEALYAANPEGRVFTHLAEAYRKAGELERAREILEAGIARHPDSATAYVVLGRVAFDHGAQQDARSAFERALELDGGNLVAHRYLGELALGVGDRGAALRHYGELLARNPSDETLQQQVRELSLPEPASQEPELPSLAPEPEPGAEPPVLESPAAAGNDALAFGEAELHPDSFDGHDLPGDLAALAGEQYEARTGRNWEPPEAEVDEAFDFSLEDIPGDLDIEPLPSLELEGLDASAGITGEAGTSAEPWSWGEPGDALEAAETPLEELLPLAGSFDEVGGGEVGDFGMLEPLPDFRDPAADDADERANAAETGFGEPAFGEEVLQGEPALGEVFVDGPIEGEPTLEDETGALDQSAFGDVDDAVSELPAFDEGEVLTPPNAPAPMDELGYEEEAAAPEAGAEDVVTETMAELYRSQGFPDRAAEVYRSLLRQHPGDERLLGLLAEVEAEAAVSVAIEAADNEGWPGNADAAFTGGAGAGENEPTPYAWDGSREEQAAPGPPIAAYFRSLLEWKPAAGAAEATAPPVDEAAPAAAADTWDMPPLEGAPWESAAAEATPAAAWQSTTPEGWLPAEALAPGAESLEEVPELVLDEIAAEPPELVLEEQAAEEPFTGWTPDLLLEPEPPSGGNAVAGVPDPSNLMPWEVPEPPVLSAPAVEPALETAPEPAAPPVAAEEPAEEDEDLEMFRSWLQSLKK